MPNPADYRYILAPVPTMPHQGGTAFGPPSDAVGWIDLRTLSGDGYGLFWGNPDMATMTGGIDCGRGDCREMGAAAFANAWETRYGVRPAGGTLVAALVDVLTTKADPAGVTAPRPLMPECPGPNPLLTVWMPGHSRVHAERMDPGHPHFPQVQRILWIEQDEIEARALGAANATLRGLARDHARRVLDWQCEKYGLSKTRKTDWERLLPPGMRNGHPGPLPHDTSYSETFTTSDSDTLGGTLTWTEVSGDIDVVSNAAEMGSISGAYKHARAEHDVSSSDHKAIGKFINMSGWDTICASGVKGRHSSSAITAYECYVYKSGSYQIRTVKWESGGLTLIGSTPSTSGSDTALWEIRCNGSTISRYINGTLDDSTTDTAIASGTRGGITMYGDNAVKPRIDDWSIEDLAAAAVQPQLMLLGVGC